MKLTHLPILPSLRRVARQLATASTLALGLAVTTLHAEDLSPFKVTPTLASTNGTRQLTLTFQMPKEHHLYADELSVEVAGQPARLGLPHPIEVKDKFSGKVRGMFTNDFAVALPFPAWATGDVALVVNLRGCSHSECYFAESRAWSVSPDLTIARVEDADSSTLAAGGPLTTGFEVARRASGYLGKEEFLRFIKPGENAEASDGNVFAGFGTLATIGLILIGGLALNLTPCVLPMIPINLAILGAGAKNGNKRRGFALGTSYGAGMALAYGGLGLAVVLTGSKFGTLNSSPWFNFAIAVVFCVMGLAMFDKLAVDFSRFQRVGPKKSSGGAFAGATIMGGFSALLAGACVAPVVISVLLLAATSYQQGNFLGLLFPFVLGLGMALPWPFAAAGLSFLPKPGMWMTRVKYGFGVIIFAFAAWYGWLGWNLTNFNQPQVAAGSRAVDELRTALETSRRTGQPVFVDFWASWCKNCEAMEHTTFSDESVKSQLGAYLVVKFQAEHLNDTTIKPVLDELGILGLPSYVVLRPAHTAVPTTAALSPATPTATANN